jgi:hypothetical protein
MATSGRRPAAGKRRTAPKPAATPARPRRARAAPAAEAAPLRIFQIYFEPWQRDLLDPDFIPFDNGGVRAELLEFDVFERLAAAPATAGAALWGALSWRFAEKTGLSGAELRAAIDAHPGRDVYFCNPHVQNEALYHNMWMQAETAHPRFLEVARALFDAAGLPADELESMLPSTRYSAANYFIGTPAFWSAYLPWVRRVLARADRNLAAPMRQLLHSTEADSRGLHAGATYVPFVVERLFPLFLRTAGRKLAAQQIALPRREAELNVHLKLLREMKDVAHRTRSPWLAACWVNYRNLYLTQLHGKAWAQRYLRAVTPTDVRFA